MGLGVAACPRTVPPNGAEMPGSTPSLPKGDTLPPDAVRRVPTIDEVAALAGVGRATVSRALNDQANVSARMRARVMDAVARLDYRVNPQARSLASRSGNALTLINCNSLDAPPNSYYFAAIELGALRAAAAEGLELSTFNVYVEDQRRHGVPGI